MKSAFRTPDRLIRSTNIRANNLYGTNVDVQLTEYSSKDQFVSSKNGWILAFAIFFLSQSLSLAQSDPQQYAPCDSCNVISNLSSGRRTSSTIIWVFLHSSILFLLVCTCIIFYRTIALVNMCFIIMIHKDVATWLDIISLVAIARKSGDPRLRSWAHLSQANKLPFRLLSLFSMNKYR